MRAYNIQWDIDEEDLEAGIDLPSEVIIPAEIAEDPEYQEAVPGTEMYEDLCDCISDWLSDTYDFCHQGFELDMEDSGVTIETIKTDIRKD